MQETALLRAVQEAALALLASCFEKYYAVSDQAATGILDGDVAATESPAPVLRHAVLLAGGVTNPQLQSYCEYQVLTFPGFGDCCTYAAVAVQPGMLYSASIA